MFELADVGMHFLHLAVIAGNVLGWMWVRARLVCFGLQLVTLGCWVGFGVAKGWWGYCPLSAWHWEIKRTLGEQELPGNYLTYIFSKWLNLNLHDEFLSGLILGMFSIAMAANIYLIFSGRKRARITST